MMMTAQQAERLTVLSQKLHTIPPADEAGQLLAMLAHCYCRLRLPFRGRK
jgi:hypothetical protein